MFLVDKAGYFLNPFIEYERKRIGGLFFRGNRLVAIDGKDRQVVVQASLVAPHIGALSLVQITRKIFHLHLCIRQGAVVQRRQSLRFAIADVVGYGPRSDTVFPGRSQVGPVRKGAERIQVFGIFIREVVVRNKTAGQRSGHRQAARDITEIGLRVGTGIFFNRDRADRIGVLHIESLVALRLGHEAAHKEAIATEIRIVDKDFARNSGEGNPFQAGRVTAKAADIGNRICSARAIALEFNRRGTGVFNRSQGERYSALLLDETAQNAAQVYLVRAVGRNSAAREMHIPKLERLVVGHFALTDEAAHEHVFGTRLDSGFNHHARGIVDNGFGGARKAARTNQAAKGYVGIEACNLSSISRHADYAISRRTHNRQERRFPALGRAFRSRADQATGEEAEITRSLEGIFDVDVHAGVHNLNGTTLLKPDTPHEATRIDVIGHALQEAYTIDNHILDRISHGGAKRHERHFTEQAAHGAPARDCRIAGTAVARGGLQFQGIAESGIVQVHVGHHARKAAQCRRCIGGAVITDLSADLDCVQGILHGHTHDTAQEHRILRRPGGRA